MPKEELPWGNCCSLLGTRGQTSDGLLFNFKAFKEVLLGSMRVVVVHEGGVLCVLCVLCVCSVCVFVCVGVWCVWWVVLLGVVCGVFGGGWGWRWRL